VGATPGQLPSDNPANDIQIKQGMENGSIYKSGLTAIGNAGEPIRLDIYFTKIADNEWAVTVYHQPNASTATAFPYTETVQDTDPITGDPMFDPVTGDPIMITQDAVPLHSSSLTFDPATG